MLSVFYGLINALYDLINTIMILFRREEGKERCKVWAWTVSEQYTGSNKKRGHWESSSSSRFIHKATISGFACSYHGLERFLFFPVIYLYLSNLQTSLSSESVTTSMNHYKPWYFLFLAIPYLNTLLMQPHRVPATTAVSS